MRRFLILHVAAFITACNASEISQVDCSPPETLISDNNFLANVFAFSSPISDISNGGIDSSVQLHLALASVGLVTDTATVSIDVTNSKLFFKYRDETGEEMTEIWSIKVPAP